MEVTMTATVVRVGDCDLLVCDECTSQEVLVRTADAGCFRAGERVCILYNGIMTLSLPPQITALSIRRLCSC